MKIGVAGSGKIVPTFMDAAAECDGIEVKAICCRPHSENKGKEFARKYNFEKVYIDYEEMLKDEELDFIYIALPNSLHYEYAKRALINNKNVICEKPFTSTVEETIELCTLAKEKKLFLFEAITTIHCPNFKAIVDNLDKIGDIKLVSCNFSQYSSRYDDFLKGEIPIVFDPKFFGGALTDLNVYNIHFITRLFGKPKKVWYDSNIAYNGIDTSGIVTMRYDDFICSCIGAKDCEGEKSIYIQGTKGYIKLNGSANECEEVEICINKEEKQLINLQKSKNRMVYELMAFRDIFNMEDYDKCLKLLEHTKDVMKIMLDARIEAGIY